MADAPEKPLANSADMVQNTPSKDMEPQEKDIRRPESGNQMWSDAPGQKKSSAGIWVALVILLLLVGLGAGGYYFYLTQNNQSANQAAEETTSEITEAPVEPTATPTPQVNRAEWTIDVQNGTGTPGLAKKVADELKTLGYNIGKVGNADESDFTTSELHVTSTDETRASSLLGDFKTYGVGQIEGDLKKATSGSAQLIVGANYTSSGASSITPEE